MGHQGLTCGRWRRPRLAPAHWLSVSTCNGVPSYWHNLRTGWVLSQIWSSSCAEQANVTQRCSRATDANQNQTTVRKHNDAFTHCISRGFWIMQIHAGCFKTQFSLLYKHKEQIQTYWHVKRLKQTECDLMIQVTITRILSLWTFP